MRNLTRLNTPCRDLLRVAALFGRTFPLDALTLALEESEEKVQTLIDEATQAAIIAKSPAVGTIWDEYTDDEAADNDTLRHISTSQLAPLTEVGPESPRLLKRGMKGRSLFGAWAVGYTLGHPKRGRHRQPA